MGVSNISFGLPERTFVNAAFLSMAISKGLTMAIANPSQALLMNSAYATDMLLNKEGSDVKYINNVRAVSASPASDAPKGDNDIQGSQIFVDVVKGNKRNIVEHVNAELASGRNPEEMINDDLISGINKVGELFEKKKYFLPQLIASAETMEMAINIVSPLVPKKNDGVAMPTLVIATVEGDIHDIGKNLVVLMLKNYGFNVIDMGKDVPAEEIVDMAVKENASLIGLSALMTTTMVRMKDVVNLVKERNLDIKVVIGGAVITQSYADEIGADGYSKDAADSVVLVKKLLNIE